MFRKFSITLACVVFLSPLAACTSTNFLEPDDGAIESFLTELREASSPPTLFCNSLQGLVLSQNNVAELIKCEGEIDTETGGTVIVVAFEDQGLHLIENNIQISFDTAFAPLTVMAQSYKEVGDSTLSSMQLFLVFFDDSCNNTWEIRPQTLSKLGTGEITFEQALDELEIYGDRNCP